MDKHQSVKVVSMDDITALRDCNRSDSNRNEFDLEHSIEIEIRLSFRIHSNTIKRIEFLGEGLS